MTAEVLVGIILTATIGSLSFFLVRFINKQDAFRDKTTTSLSNIKFELKEQTNKLKYQMDVIQKDLKEIGMESHTKRDIKKLAIQLDLLQKDIETKIRPNLFKPDENYGRILVLEKKILTMFKTVEVLAERLPKSRQE